MSAPGGHKDTKISAEFYARQRVIVSCAHCGDSQDGLHPDDAAVWFAEHRRLKHPGLPPVKKAGRRVTPNTYSHQRRFQSDEELAWREDRRFIHTSGRAR